MPSPTSSATVHLIIEGHVQGVGFRYFTQEVAQALILTGWVKNLPNGSVEVFAQGHPDVLQALVDRLRRGPQLSRVIRVQENWHAPAVPLTTFSIR